MSVKILLMSLKNIVQEGLAQLLAGMRPFGFLLMCSNDQHEKSKIILGTNSFKMFLCKSR